MMATPESHSLGHRYHTGAAVSVSQLAHIFGWSTSAGSPRGNDPLVGSERNDEEDLMVLCYDQHRVIDNRSLWDVRSTSPRCEPSSAVTNTAFGSSQVSSPTTKPPFCVSSSIPKSRNGFRTSEW
jgi:hypothetical protein